MARSKLPREILEFFRKQGAKGGKIGGSKGGKRSAEILTPEARRERARKAAKASAAVRAKKKKALPS
jgi:hypothetical protein